MYIELEVSIVDFSTGGIFSSGNFEFWTQKSFFFEKKAHTSRIIKGWLVGWAYGLLFVVPVTVKK